ncbi:MAG TPA: c-type cytochrome [Burkholderiaceae bacterium]|nr:c-type cytochrome [Burkholderiaceae bacterium]
MAIAAGERIYRYGVLPTGAPVLGERVSMPAVQAGAAACVNCHRRSGLGEVEGPMLVPPVTARHLYNPRAASRPDALHDMALMMREPGAHTAVLPQSERSAYTDATLARAIREGIGADGRALDYVMPRFRFDDADMASLIAYLKQLSRRPSPGVGDDTLQFATVITPDADPVKRQGMLDVLEHFFGEENVFRGGKGPPPQLSRRFLPIAHRWQLHVWELSGPNESWGNQLDQRLQREPVFALISGIGGRTWKPVHRFCERSGLPCIFPNVDLPVVGEPDDYDLYLSKGVLLEAQLIGARLQQLRRSPDAARSGWQRVVQVYRRGDIGEAAAAQLLGVLAPPAVDAVDRALESGAGATPIGDALPDVGPGDALVLWLRPGDLKSLPSTPPPSAAVFVSGIMGGLEGAPLAGPWRELARMTYPFDLPERRRMRLDDPLGWMRFKHIPVVDERTQTDTYLACRVAAETVSMMREDLVRDHLIETFEMHLGMNLLNGYYPRLELAAGDHFASKGAFLVRFADPEGPRLVADGDWSVP